MKKRLSLEQAVDYLLNELQIILGPPPPPSPGTVAEFYGKIVGFGEASEENGYLIVEGDEGDLESLADFEEVPELKLFDGDK